MSEANLICKMARHLRKLEYNVTSNLLLVPGRSEFGEMDIVAYKGNTILEVECKWINRTNPTQKRKKVKTQAITYASILKWKFPQKKIFAVVYTNEGLSFLGEITSTQAAHSFFERVGLKSQKFMCSAAPRTE